MRKFTTFLGLSFLLFSGTLLSNRASGAVVVAAYDRATFVPLLTDTTTEDFQSFTVTANYPYNTPQNLGNITVTAIGTSAYLTDFRMTAYEPPVGGRRLEMWVNRYDPAIQSFTIDLGRPVSAFGADFNLNNANNWPAVHFIVNGVDRQPSGLSTIANTQFLGITDTTPFQTITITTNPGEAFYTQMDNVVFGNIPEPASMSLLAIGSLTVIIWRKKA